MQREGAGACGKLANPAWRSSEWYIFVLDGDGGTVCHPIPQQIGANAHDLVDTNGKRFGDEFLSVAAAGGGRRDAARPAAGTAALLCASYTAAGSASPGTSGSVSAVAVGVRLRATST